MDEKTFLTQYCNLLFEWRTTGIDIDTASDFQKELINELREKAMQQSGMTFNELYLVSNCRVYGILREANVYTRKIISML